MQFWPRVRAKKPYPRVRTWPDSDNAKILGFAGYKVGMTHVMGTDNVKGSPTEGEEKPYPVTVIECPPIKIVSVRTYEEKEGNPQPKDELFVGDHQDLSRKLTVPDETQEDEIEDINPEEVSDIRVIAHTIPRQTGVGKKTPEVFELGLGGSNADKLQFIKENIGQEIRISDVFGEGDLVDTHSITKGKGTQGPVKRFGIGLKPHKSEKGRRRPGSLGGWKAQQHFMYRVPMAGQTGYQQRTQYNIQIFKVDDNPEDINVEGGFKKYGEVKNDYILVKGSVPGSRKRMILFTEAARPPKKMPELPTINYISTTSKQGR